MADIKVKLGVDGEASFKQAIQESTGAVKEMKSALSLAASKYALTGDKAQFLKDKAAALKGEIEAQQGVVEAIQGALENAKAKYGDAATKTMQWRTRLNMANTALNTMQSELESTTEDLEGIGTAAEGSTEDTDALGESIDGINEEGNLDNLLAGLQKVGEFAGNAAKKAWEIGTALWGGTVEASDWADEILTLGTQYNLDTSTLQGWRYASNLIDTEVDTILSARQKMIKNMAYPNDDVAALWQALGIQTDDGEGGLRDANDVFWEAIEALGRIENETDRDAAAMLLFGKRAAELNPLIEAGRDAWEASVKEAGELGVILDDADVQKLGEFNDELQKMNAVVESMKLKFYAALAPGMTIIAEALKTASVQLSAFLESAEGKAAIEQLGQTIAKFVTTLVDKLPELLPLMTKLVEAATQLLSFIADHAGELMGVLGTLFVGGEASKFMSWAKDIPILGTLLFGSRQTAAAAGAGAETAGKTGLFPWLGNLLGPVAVPAAVVGGSVATFNAIDKKGTARFNAHFNGAGTVAMAEAGGELTGVAKAMADLYTVMTQIQDDPGVGLDAMRTYFEGIDQDTLDAMHELLPDLEWWNELPEITPESVNNYLKGLDNVTLLTDAEGMLDTIGAMFADGGIFAEGGQNAGESYAEALEGTAGDAEAAGEAVGESAESGAAGTDLSGGGNNAGKTFVDTIFSWNPSAWAAGFSLGESAADGLGAALDINSPSRVMREMGGFVAEGFAEGINDGVGMVEDAVYAMSDATVGTAMHHQDGRPGGNMAEMLVNALNGVTVNIDGQTAGRLIAPTVSAVMGDEADAWRYEAE